MQYNSWLYLLAFLSCTLLLYYALPLRFRWCALLAASAAFYWISSRTLILVVLASAAVVYGCALLMERERRRYQEQKDALEREERRALKGRMERRTRAFLILGCAFAFGVLFFTKYFNFVGENLNLLLPARCQIPVLHLLMPLGISFYTLSAVSYLADVCHGGCHAQRNYGKLLLFLLFFPVITEGPICRYGQLGEQVAEGHRFDLRAFCFGIQLILWGLLQKVVLADRLDRFVGAVFDNSGAYSGSVILFAMLMYTFQIYMDFAGCVDIARGSAELFGIELPLNFSRPFFANTVNDFWRRWHITLGAWLRDYIFYPISLSRPFQTLSRHSRKHLNAYYAATLPALCALLAVWFGNGVWHGAEWKYICYGLYYYAITALGMLLEPAFVRLLGVLRLERTHTGYRVFQTLRTFLLVNIGMLLFRANDLHTAWAMLRSVFRPYDGSFSGVLSANGLPCGQLALVVIGACAVLAVGVLQERGASIRESVAAWRLPARWCAYLALLLFVLLYGAYGPGFGIVDFIYAQF
jgi:alginate O-acetyltransferase complex protein AlgI